MSISNPEFIEELMYKAHARGFFHKMHPRVDELKQKNPGIQQSDAYYKAYELLKAEHEIESDHGDTDHIDHVDEVFSVSGESSYDDDSYDY